MGTKLSILPRDTTGPASNILECLADHCSTEEFWRNSSEAAAKLSEYFALSTSWSQCRIIASAFLYSAGEISRVSPALDRFARPRVSRGIRRSARAIMRNLFIGQDIFSTESKIK